MPYKAQGPIADWLDPRRKSVFDPLYKRAIRSAAGMLGLNDPDSALETAAPSPLAPIASVVTGVGRRIAPKRAAKELVDVLLGRSKRVPAPEKLTEEAALRAALERSRVTGTAPPPPTELTMSQFSNFIGPRRKLPRTPGLNDEFKKWQRSRGANPDYVNPVTINETRKLPGDLPASTGHKRKNILPASPEISALLRKEGSLQEKMPFKLKTEQELKALIEGPRTALKRKAISVDDYRRISKENNKKIDDYFHQLKELDKRVYDESMENRIRASMMGQ